MGGQHGYGQDNSVGWLREKEVKEIGPSQPGAFGKNLTRKRKGGHFQYSGWGGESKWLGEVEFTAA